MTTAERLFQEAVECDKNQDYEQAFTLYSAAAELGYVPAYPNVGYAYLNGEGTEKDYNKAVEFFQKGVDAGNMTSVVNLGVCYSYGYGVQQDKQKALALYKQAADAGNALGKTNYEKLQKEMSSNLKVNDLPPVNNPTPPAQNNNNPPLVYTGVGGLGSGNRNSPMGANSPAAPKSVVVNQLKRRIYGKYIFCYICAVICLTLLFVAPRFPELFATPGLTAVMSLLMVATLYPGLGGILATPGLIKRVKHMNRLEQRGLLDLAAREVLTGKTVAFGDKALMSEHFLFRKQRRGLIIPCEDVLWFYTGRTSRYCDFYIGTRYNGVMVFSGVSRYVKNFDDVVNAMAQRLLKHNPDLLINNTPENKAEYNRRRYTN